MLRGHLECDGRCVGGFHRADATVYEAWSSNVTLICSERASGFSNTHRERALLNRPIKLRIWTSLIQLVQLAATDSRSALSQVCCSWLDQSQSRAVLRRTRKVSPRQGLQLQDAENRAQALVRTKGWDLTAIRDRRMHFGRAPNA